MPGAILTADELLLPEVVEAKKVARPQPAGLKMRASMPGLSAPQGNQRASSVVAAKSGVESGLKAETIKVADDDDDGDHGEPVSKKQKKDREGNEKKDKKDKKERKDKDRKEKKEKKRKAETEE